MSEGQELLCGSWEFFDIVDYMKENHRQVYDQEVKVYTEEFYVYKINPLKVRYGVAPFCRNFGGLFDEPSCPVVVNGTAHHTKVLPCDIPVCSNIAGPY